MSSVLEPLLARLRKDGGRYLLSVALTPEERDAQPDPTYGGKGHIRWLTDEEYAALCTLRPLDFVAALKTAEDVFEQYRKDQPKWWKRMDGTPILNDVAVRMAEAFRKVPHV